MASNPTSARSKDVLKLVASILASYTAGAIGGLATTANIPTWYAALEKPVFNPPNWVFGPVWSALYLLIGISLFLVWKHETKEPKTTAYAAWIVQIILNTVWSLVFFGLHSPEGGIVVIFALIFGIITTMRAFYPFSKWAAYLLVPYLLWVGFATSLTIAIAVLN